MLIGLKDNATYLSYAVGDLVFRKGEKKKVDKETGQYLLLTGLFVVYDNEEENQPAQEETGKAKKSK